MIGVPFEDNDLTCLGRITEIIARLVSERPVWLVELAARFGTTAELELTAWIRGLPQRHDEGLDNDGPKVAACERGSACGSPPTIPFASSVVPSTSPSPS